MGTYSFLKLSEIEFGFCKNFLAYHGWLFTKDDIHKIKVLGDQDGPAKYPIYRTKLSNVKERLALSGYHPKSITYENVLYYDSDYSPTKKDLQLHLRLLTEVEIKKVKGLETPSLNEPYYYELPEKRLIEYCKKYNINPFDTIHPYFLLSLLCSNANNLDCDLIYDNYELVENGYVKEKEYSEDVDISEGKFLIITEGASDTHIIKKALELRKPRIKKLFNFVDMENNYPFVGAGNLYRFIQGLIKIGYNNYAVVILDNDAEGQYCFKRLLQLNLPSNIKPILLPKLKEANRMATIGPGGKRVQDINGKAVSIECFLDLKYGIDFLPAVRWTNYKDEVSCYQGSLIKKDHYSKVFHSIKQNNTDYNFMKIDLLIDKILSTCIQFHFPPKNRIKMAREDKTHEDLRREKESIW